MKTDNWLADLIRQKASPLLQSILDKPETHRYQIIYTQINRDAENRPDFQHFYLNVDRNRYFNPASMVKLPVAILALEKLNRMKVPGVTCETTMLTDTAGRSQTPVTEDSSSASGLPSIAHYIKKIFLVSDNDAYNRLYEFVGQKTINERLHAMGYKDSRITRRFAGMTEEENRHTNPIRFVKGDRVLFSQKPARSDFEFDFSREILMGRAHYDRNDQLINEPFDFTRHNFIPLEDLQQILQSVLFPGSVRTRQRFKLKEEDCRFLYEYMSMLPSESDFPAYDGSKFFDSYTKFFFFKAGRGQIPDYIRSFNKTGWSYGFLTDVCYIVDFKNNIEFMLSGNIYVNEDEVLNDDKYEYEEIGYPFFKEIGEIIYNFEIQRERTVAPDLSDFGNLKVKSQK